MLAQGMGGGAAGGAARPAGPRGSATDAPSLDWAQPPSTVEQLPLSGEVTYHLPPAEALKQLCMASKWLLMLPTCRIERMMRRSRVTKG